MIMNFFELNFMKTIKWKCWILVKSFYIYQKYCIAKKKNTVSDFPINQTIL